MRPFILSSAALLTFIAGTTLADDGRVATRAEVAQLMTEIGQHMDAQAATFTRHAEAAQKLTAMYATLDTKATAVGRLAQRCARGCSPDTQDQLLAATKAMQETQMSFNQQYLQLQSQMQQENRSYTAVSNILKAKHDVVKSSISNIR